MLTFPREIDTINTLIGIFLILETDINKDWAFIRKLKYFNIHFKFNTNKLYLKGRKVCTRKDMELKIANIYIVEKIINCGTKDCN